MMLIKQLSVFVENRPGRLSEITGVLRDAKVDIRALTIADTTDFGILRLIVDNPEKAQAALREAKLTVSITSVIGVRLPDAPGGLCGALEALRDADVSVEYCYAFISHSSNDAHVILRVDQAQKAIDTLGAAGYQFLAADKLYNR
ncbi:MAG: ACT domain-containing protein [Oscillospiraceae bacterium]